MALPVPCFPCRGVRVPKGMEVVEFPCLLCCAKEMVIPYMMEVQRQLTQTRWGCGRKWCVFAVNPPRFNRCFASHVDVTIERGWCACGCESHTHTQFSHQQRRFNELFKLFLQTGMCCNPMFQLPFFSFFVVNIVHGVFDGLLAQQES